MYVLVCRIEKFMQCIVLLVLLQCVRTIILHRVTYPSVILHEMHT